ncbi:hypothetical protein [Mycobacteroides abscessus]|uniref:hypothetical protein n=1 Tax=Mycobacteroides abscessus TaxID=36809 RepID=UPI000927DD81|nr:hypothetical protein [Mycobacteroides abscessus]SIF19085.1 Uncharacterised protein [Mycobacteroides abscessus subsp. abscessus]
MAEVTPFLTVTEFEGMFRPLSATEQALAEILVRAAAAWIRDPSRLPDLPASDERGKLVTYDVVKAMFGPEGVTDSRVTELTRTTDDRTLTVKLAQAAEMLDFTERHLQMLGLSLTAAPQAIFTGYAQAEPW